MTESQPKTFADLTFPRMLCKLHGEPFRAEWPKGAIIFQLTGLREVLDKDHGELASLMTGLTDEHRARGIEALLDYKPVCCRLPRERLESLYGEAGIGMRARCVACQKKGPGTELRTRAPDGSVFTIRHVCFHCVAFNAYEDIS